MILLGIWLAAALLVGACWAIAGLLIAEPTESPSGTEALEAEDEAA